MQMAPGEFPITPSISYTGISTIVVKHSLVDNTLQKIPERGIVIIVSLT